ncbi:hypothetical protein SLE2022_042920 [Rubroshorea leprosula]
MLHTFLLQRLSIASVCLTPCSFPTPKPAAQIYLSTRPTRSATIRCMTNPRRVKMEAQQIRRELSDMLVTDKVLQYAVSPEAAWELTGDSCLPWLTTISNVEVSADLLVIAILDRIKAKKKIAEAEAEEQFDSSDSSQDDKDWEDDDTDEDIIQVK